ncbi:MAG: response regulator [Treponema sp.]|jgi:CheY-like chemotaxis protein|nr:response regulator [Treponema sp.]
MNHIIHADNSEFFRKLMKSFLVELGLEIKSFAQGEEVINAVKQGGTSYVITGLELADMKGEELIKRLMVLPEHVPIIIVTSNEKELRSKRLNALGIKAMLSKSENWKDELKSIII